MSHDLPSLNVWVEEQTVVGNVTFPGQVVFLCQNLQYLIRISYDDILDYIRLKCDTVSLQLLCFRLVKTDKIKAFCQK